MTNTHPTADDRADNRADDRADDRAVDRNGARGLLLLRALTVTLLWVLTMSVALAETRTPRLRRSSAVQELRVPSTARARSRHARRPGSAAERSSRVRSRSERASLYRVSRDVNRGRLERSRLERRELDRRHGRALHVARWRRPEATPDRTALALLQTPHQQLPEAAVQPVLLPVLYRNGRLVMPAPLKGSHDILVHQNLMADDEGLERIRDEEELDRLRASHELVDFTESASLHVNPELAYDRRCARAWTVRFATDISQAFYARFHQPLQLNSAVRTVQFQLRLQHVNGNAAQVNGDVASPHLTGEAIDFGKREMTRDQIAWMRAYLLPLMQAGEVDVEEEFQQACFHISVYRGYHPALKHGLVKNEVAQLQ